MVQILRVAIKIQKYSYVVNERSLKTSKLKVIWF